jgi:hypothetical protein
MQASMWARCKLASSISCGSKPASARTSKASSSSAPVLRRSLAPDRSVSIALLRTMLISQVMGVATLGL